MWMTIWRCVLSPRYPTPFCCVVMAKRQNTFQQTPVYTTKTTLALSILYCSNANTGTQRANGAPTKLHAVPSACMMSSFWPLEWVWGLVWPTLFFYIISFFTQRRSINFLPYDWHCFRSWRQSSEQNRPSLTWAYRVYMPVRVTENTQVYRWYISVMFCEEHKAS